MSNITPVSRIEWAGVCVPFRRPFATANGTSSDRYSLLLMIHAGDGLTGYGEAGAVGPGTSGCLQDLAALLRQVSHSLIGLPPSSVPGRARALLKGRPLARSLLFALDTATLDVLGKARERPVARLLGGMSRQMPVNATLSLGAPDETAQEALRAVADGFPTLKLKITGEAERDVAVLKAVRAAVGDGVRLRLDPNQAWQPADAIQALKRLQPFGIEYVEQPVAADDIAGLAEIRRQVGVPVAADEALTSLSRARTLLLRGAADILIVKAARIGTLREAAAVLRLAARRNVPAVVTSSLETGIGLAASLHLAALGDPGWPASGLATGLLLESDLLAQPLVLVKGIMQVPAGPGLGVELDEAALRCYRAGPSGRVGLS